MSTAKPVIVQPTVRTQSWIGRHWYWFFPVVFAPFCICCGCLSVPFIAVTSALTGTQVFEDALAEMNNSEELIEYLGEPIERGAWWDFRGSINIENDEGSANMEFPVRGPRGTGRAEFEATLEDGVWYFDSFLVYVDGVDDPIQLVE